MSTLVNFSDRKLRGNGRGMLRIQSEKREGPSVGVKRESAATVRLANVVRPLHRQRSIGGEASFCRVFAKKNRGTKSERAYAGLRRRGRKRRSAWGRASVLTEQRRGRCDEFSVKLPKGEKG